MLTRDAGEMRETLAERFGAALTFGGYPGVMNRAVRYAKLISRLTGISLMNVLETARADYENIERER